MKATLEGPKFDKVVFHGPGKEETYMSTPILSISEDGRFATISGDDSIDLKQGLKVVKRDGIYVAYSNGTVRDTSTDLEWKVGPDRDMRWNEAQSWVKSLGNDWRMPTIDELEGLYEEGKGDMNMTPFFKTSSDSVWSSETRVMAEGILSFKMYFDFSNGYDTMAMYSPEGVRAFAVRYASDE